MISIRFYDAEHFNNLFFVSLSALSNYIVTVYGSWAQVPENHPDIAIVNALTGHNMDYYTEVDGRLEPHYPCAPKGYTLREVSQRAVDAAEEAGACVDTVTIDGRLYAIED